MSNNIFILDENNSLIRMNKKNYNTENKLQVLIAKYPSLIDEAQLESDGENKLLLISREVSIPAINNLFTLDHLFLDQNGIPTFVEVKRSTDSRIRREVVGQMLDYAANALDYWPISRIKELLISRCENEGLNPDKLIQELLKNDTTTEEFWENVYDNLDTGRVRLLFVADKIPQVLRSIIEFLNEKMDSVEVLGVEINQYTHNNLKTLVPNVVGQTSKAQIKKNQNKGKWDEVSFLSEIEKRFNEEYKNIAQNLLNDFREKVTRIYWGEGMRSGSFIPIYEGNSKHQLFAVWTYGKIGLYFEHYKFPFNEIYKKKELQSKLNKIKGLNITDDQLSKRPSLEIYKLNEENNYQKLISAYDWFIEEIKKDEN